MLKKLNTHIEVNVDYKTILTLALKQTHRKWNKIESPEIYSQ